ncbi:hypothetical protein HAHE_17810 [Haloferula helveola]|uniref:Uncharacterized protein n=1 Tax=Haloferula helveola TaxID=490095 RepID=A0ABN6H7H5_9BACT|nr:hypothetical protein HAHE_17810 [Haloferula helveola]
MGKKRILIRAAVALVLVWAVIIGIRAIAGSKRVTAEKIAREISASEFEDWSEGIPEGAVISDREARIREVAGMYNRLDFAEREKAQQQRVGERMFEKMADSEKELFIDLTVSKTMENFMRALDAMSAEERRGMVERGLREIKEGKTQKEMERAEEISEELLNRISEEGMKAYFEEAGTQTKLDLAPLMQAMDDLMKGMRGNEFPQGQ